MSVVTKIDPFASTVTPPGATSVVGDERPNTVLERPECADRRELVAEHERAGEPVLGQLEHVHRPVGAEREVEHRREPGREAAAAAVRRDGITDRLDAAGLDAPDPRRPLGEREARQLGDVVRAVGADRNGGRYGFGRNDRADRRSEGKPPRHELGPEVSERRDPTVDVDLQQIVRRSVGHQHIAARQQRDAVRVRLRRIRRLVEVVVVRMRHLVGTDVGHQLDVAVRRDSDQA